MAEEKSEIIKASSSSVEEAFKHPIDTIKRTGQHFIGSIKHIAQHEIDNIFILHGYRVNYNTPILILKSLFHKHNELINVWTHLLGAICAMIFIFYVASQIAYVSHLKMLLSDDLERLFNVIEKEYFSINNQVSNFTQTHWNQFLNELDTLSDKVQTPESYQELMNTLYETKNILSFDWTDNITVSKYEQLFKQRMDNIKNNLLYEIESNNFDWVEIYRYDYRPFNLDLKLKTIPLRKPNDPLRTSRWPIFVFLISAIMCMGGSALFHLFYQMSEKANRYLMRVDYAGISLLILGSTFPPFYYGFYCDTVVRYLYLFLVGSACTAVYVISIFDFIHSEPWRKVKGIMYGSLGLFAGVPTIHLYYRELHRGEPGTDYLPFDHTFIYYILMGASYLVGLAFYVLRIPERFCPGRFDIFGHSHQIWHCFVFLGVLFSYMGALENLHDRRFISCIIR